MKRILLSLAIFIIMSNCSDSTKSSESDFRLIIYDLENMEKVNSINIDATYLYLKFKDDNTKILRYFESDFL